MFTPIDNAGAIGVNRDLSATDALAQNAWTDASNIRFLDGAAHQALGYQTIYDPPTVIPYHVLPVTVAGVKTWIYGGAATIYKVDSTGTHTNITRAAGGAYTATINSWTSCVLGGLPIMNNGTDVPQYWLLTGVMIPLPAFPANTTCAVIRNYKNSLIALDLTTSGTRYPYDVLWSHPADPNTAPTTWDITDTTKDAGRISLSDGYGYIVDGGALRDSFMVYKTDGVFRLDYTGGAFIYRQQKVLGMSGAMTRNCWCEIDGFHLVLTTNDIVFHDGQQATSILDKRGRRDFFRRLDETYGSTRSFVFRNAFYSEVWVCFPQAGSTYCDTALVYNWIDKTVSYRTLPTLTHAASGPLATAAATTFDAATGIFDAAVGAFNNTTLTPDPAKVLAASSDQSLYYFDSTPLYDGVACVSYLERTGLHFGAPNAMKCVKGLRPRLVGDNGGTVYVSVGGCDDPYNTPEYCTPVAFTIGSSVSCDFFVTGRYIGVKFTSGTAYSWRLDGYEIDVAKAGGY
jgi:hypothetical protein